MFTPIIRETIAYKTVAADGLKDIILMDEEKMIVVTISQFDYLPNCFDSENKIDLESLKLTRLKYPIWCTRYEEIKKVEKLIYKETGNFLMGNSIIQGIEIRIKDNADKVIGLNIDAAEFEKILEVLISKPDILVEEVKKFTIKAQRRRGHWIWSYYGIISIPLIMVLLLITLIIDITTGDSDFIWKIFFFPMIILMLLFFFRIFKGFYFRKSNHDDIVADMIGLLSVGNLIDTAVELKVFDKPIRNLTVGVFLKTFFGGLIIYGIIKLLIFTPQMVEVYSKSDSLKTIYSIPQILINIFAPALIIGLFELGYRLSYKVKTDGVIPKDKFILFLRSFKDDNKYSFNHDFFSSLPLSVSFSLKDRFPARTIRFSPFRLLRILFDKPRDTSEQQLTSLFEGIAPVISIGNSNTLLPSSDRYYFQNDEWQDKVILMMEKCEYIIIQPSETEGVMWELEKIAAIKDIHKVLFCLVNFRQNVLAYEKFKEAFEKISKDWLAVPLPPKMPDEHFLFFTKNGEPHFLPSHYLNPLTWPIEGHGFDFKRTLMPFFNQKPEEIEKNNNFAWGTVYLAIFLWYVLPFICFFGYIIMKSR